jgi:hypothetical protein
VLWQSNGGEKKRQGRGDKGLGGEKKKRVRKGDTAKRSGKDAWIKEVGGGNNLFSPNFHNRQFREELFSVKVVKKLLSTSKIGYVQYRIRNKV